VTGPAAGASRPTGASSGSVVVIVSLIGWVLRCAGGGTRTLTSFDTGT
jgi:hypothetical protein